MRSVITVSVILALFIILIVTSAFFVNTSTKALTSKIDLIINAVEEENWHLARSLFLQMHKQLEEKSEIFEAIYNHVEFDQILISHTRAESYIEQKWQDNALCELSQLKMLINHLAEKDKLAFYNIF